MTTTTAPRPSAAQARALDAALTAPHGYVTADTAPRTMAVLRRNGWVGPLGEITDAGRAAIGAPVATPADDDQATEQAREDAAVAVLVARTGHYADCLRERVGAILENDALNVATGHVPADYVRSVDSLAEDAADLDCRDWAECHDDDDAEGFSVALSDTAAVHQATADLEANLLAGMEADQAVDAAVGAAIARRETADGAPRLLSIGTRVRTDDDRTGTVVAGSLWTVSVAEGRDPGDRVVSMDATGERLVWDRRFLTVLSGPVVVNGVACDAPRVLAVETAVTVRGAAQYPGREPERVTVPAGTVVTVLPHPVPGYVALIGERADDAVAFIIGAVRAEQLDTYAPVASDDTDVMGEARGWLADCGLPTGGDDAAIVARVGREYDGGWSAFLAATVPAPVTPAVACPAEWTGGLVCTRDDDHGDDDHRTTLFGRPVTFRADTSTQVDQDTPAVAAETAAAPSGRARSAERTEFLSDVLCAALEGGIGYWSAADDITRTPDDGMIGWHYSAVTLFEIGDGDDACSVNDGRCRGHRVTLDTVASAVNKISKTKRADCPGAGGFHYGYVNTVRDASMENDGGEIDADAADIIVQVAALGSVVYG